MKTMGLRACWAGAMLVLTACGGGGSSAGDSSGAAGGAKWFTYERAEDYPGVVQVTGAKIAMDDGVQLSATVTLPADADGNAVATPRPVILTQTGYNKSIPAIPAYNAFLVRHGYVHVSVDVRGTGLSEGDWEAFSEREQADYAQVMDWVATQPWSNGTVGTWGASFMGTTQIYTAAHQHPAHKAVFAIVPMADAYRDIVFSGGQTNVGFIPLWMGLVTGLGAIPAEPDPAAPEIIASHIINALTHFQVPVIAQSVIGTGEYNDDGPFWRTRSPIEVADRIRIPTFIVGGLNDIFQRGEPLLYEKIARNTTAKLLIGPWQHLGGSSGEGLPRDGVPDLDHIALMWFDRYLKGMDAAAADEAGNTVLQQPLNGLCSTSTSQWTAGLLGTLPLPCFTDNSSNENPLLEVTFTTAPMSEDYVVNGPIQADLWIATTALDAALLVRVTDVSPDGGSRELTNGILTASLRQVDPARSRYLDGQMIQPWHPFTEDSREDVGMDTPVLLPIEVFPSSFVIKQGHSLRVSVGASDFPHGLPPLTGLVDQAVGALTVYSDAGRASSLVVPAVPLSAIAAVD